MKRLFGVLLAVLFLGSVQVSMADVVVRANVGTTHHSIHKVVVHRRVVKHVRHKIVRRRVVRHVVVKHVVSHPQQSGVNVNLAVH